MGISTALVLSAVDNNGYYDQIGLASDYGCPSGCNNPSNTWSIAYEQGTYGTYGGFSGCGWGGNHSRDAYDSSGLTPNTWYTFMMYLTGSRLRLTVYPAYSSWNGSYSWTTWIADTASSFYIQSTGVNCNGGGSAATMTLYEEVSYLKTDLAQQVPRWNFNFSGTTYANWGGSTWTYTGVFDSVWGSTRIVLVNLPYNSS